MIEVLKKEEIDDKVINYKGSVIIDFWNEGCGPCQALAPELEKVSSKETFVKYYSVNISKEPDLVSRFNVMAAPTLLFIKDGEVKKKTIGFKSEAGIIDIINQYIKE